MAALLDVADRLARDVCFSTMRSEPTPYPRHSALASTCEALTNTLGSWQWLYPAVDTDQHDAAGKRKVAMCRCRALRVSIANPAVTGGGAWPRWWMWHFLTQAAACLLAGAKPGPLAVVAALVELAVTSPCHITVDAQPHCSY